MQVRAALRVFDLDDHQGVDEKESVWPVAGYGSCLYRRSAAREPHLRPWRCRPTTFRERISVKRDETLGVRSRAYPGAGQEVR